MNANPPIQSRHISCVIPAEPNHVYDVLINPHNLSTWAQGLANSEIKYEGDDLIVNSPMGEVRVHFIPRNAYRIADHVVTLPSGTTVNNPVRVLDHPHGSEVVFTVRQIDASDDEFDRDCSTVADDLTRLRNLITQ